MPLDLSNAHIIGCMTRKSLTLGLFWEEVKKIHGQQLFGTFLGANLLGQFLLDNWGKRPF